MNPLLRLVSLAFLAASLSALSGCGGGGKEAPETRSLPTSNYLDPTYEGLDVGVAPAMLVLQARGGTQLTYSRLGRLGLNNEGQLIHADGALVMGRSSGSDSSIAPIPKAPLTVPARLTTRFAIKGIWTVVRARARPRHLIRFIRRPMTPWCRVGSRSPANIS